LKGGLVMRNFLLKACAGALFVVIALSLGACNRVTKKSVWKDMSPEMQTLSRTADQRTTRQKRSYDTNLRQLNDDWDMLLLQDRPMWLSEYPVP